jgi:hypothetical protein
LDLVLVATTDSPADPTTGAKTGDYRLVAQSATGVLWLQTHFEAEHWPLLAEGHACVHGSSASLIDTDARAAGLAVRRLPSSPTP